jgi:hypothetical protein
MPTLTAKQPDFKETTALQKFRSRIQYLNQHSQLVDASLTKTAKYLQKYKPKETFISTALGESTDTHDTLNHPTKETFRIINYSRAKNSEYAIIELYNCFTEYMRNILTEMYRKEPMKIVQKIAEENKDNKLSFSEIVTLGDYTKISELMVSKVFRKLENERSTSLLLEKILNHTKVKIKDSLKQESLMYLQMRHLFIHNRGLADKLFAEEFKDLTATNPGNKLPTNFNSTSRALETVAKLCETIDLELIKENLVDKRVLTKRTE